MTTKVLTGVYTTGYAISYPITTLSIASSGFVEGKGVYADNEVNAAYTVINNGGIVGSGNAVYLTTGGLVVNGASNIGAIISGVGDGVVILYGSNPEAIGTVANYGTIASSTTATPTAGVYLDNGGLVTNGSAFDKTATISGGQGVRVTSVGYLLYSATVRNFGAISGDAAFTGVDIDMGQVVNGSATDTTAEIIGGYGVRVASGYGAITNYGRIYAVGSGAYASAIDLAGGTITNGSASDTSAYAGGVNGVFAAGYAKVRNFGTIQGGEVGVTAGIWLGTNGSVVNGSATDTMALIRGEFGVHEKSAVSVENYGRILGSNDEGIYAIAGGQVTNGGAKDTIALIAGRIGILMSGDSEDPGEFTNFGTVQGGISSLEEGAFVSGGDAVLVNGAATDSAALIEGYIGVEMNDSATGSNFGVIEGEAGYGAEINVQAVLTNQASGTIQGWSGAALTNGTLIDFGLVSGASGSAVEVENGTLEVEAGAVFKGSVTSNAGGTLVLAGSSGTISTLTTGKVVAGGPFATTTFSGFGAVEVGSGGVFTLTANAASGPGVLLDVAGSLSTAHSLTIADSLSVSGTVGGTGTLVLAGATASLDTGADLTIADVSETAGSSVADVYATLLKIADTWDQVVGTVSVAASDKVLFTGSGDVFDGTLAGAGTVEFTGGSDALTGSHLTAASVIVNGAAVTLSGAIVLSHTVSVTSTDLAVGAAGATLSGAGEVLLTTNTTNAIKGGALDNTSRIEGAGLISVASLVNSGTILANSTDALTLSAGATTIANSGLIENQSTGGLTVTSAIANTGALVVTKGTLTIDGAVTGAGSVKIEGGTADLAGAFSGAVAFTTAGGTLALAHSRTDTVTITGFAKTPITVLDLKDIAFTGATVSYSGTATSGTLTVKNGAEVATIILKGNYLTSTFTLANDGAGGVLVTDPAVAMAKPPSPTQPLITAMAGFGAKPVSGGPGTRSLAPHMDTTLVRP